MEEKSTVKKEIKKQHKPNSNIKTSKMYSRGQLLDMELNHFQIDHSNWPLGFKWVSRRDISFYGITVIFPWYSYGKRGNFIQRTKRKRYNNLLALVATWLLFDVWPRCFYDITMKFLLYLLWGFIQTYYSEGGIIFAKTNTNQ